MIWDNESGSKERERKMFLHTIFYFKLISSVQKSWQFCNQKPYWQVVSLLEPPTNNYAPNMIMTLWTCIKEKQPAVIRFIFFIMGGLGVLNKRCWHVQWWLCLWFGKCHKVIELVSCLINFWTKKNICWTGLEREG